MQYKVVIILVGSSTLTYNSVSQSYRPNFFFVFLFILCITHYNTLDYAMYRVAVYLFLCMYPPLQIKFLNTISTLNALILIKIMNYCSFEIINLFGILLPFCLTKFRLI